MSCIMPQAVLYCGKWFNNSPHRQKAVHFNFLPTEKPTIKLSSFKATTTQAQWKQSKKKGIWKEMEKSLYRKIIFMETIKGKIQTALAYLLIIPLFSHSRCFRINDSVYHQFMLIAQTVAGMPSNDPNQSSWS